LKHVLSFSLLYQHTQTNNTHSYGNDSFTAAIPRLWRRYGRKVDLVYFYLIRLNNIRRKVRDVWEGVFCSADDTDSSTSLPIRAYGVDFDDFESTKESELFARLGREALKFTQAKAVYSFGGGDTTKMEVLRGASDVIWHVWPVSRIRDGNRLEMCHLNDVRDHPNVKFMFEAPDNVFVDETRVLENNNKKDLCVDRLETVDEEEKKKKSMPMTASDLFGQDRVEEEKERDKVDMAAFNLFGQDRVEEEDKIDMTASELFVQERVEEEEEEKQQQQNVVVEEVVNENSTKKKMIMTASDLFGEKNSNNNNNNNIFEQNAPATPSNEPLNVFTVSNTRQEENARKLQSIVRGRLARRRYSQERAAVRVQSVWRGKSERGRHEIRRRSLDVDDVVSSLVKDISSGDEDCSSKQQGQQQEDEETNLDHLISEQEREHEEAQRATTEALAVLHELELLEQRENEEKGDMKHGNEKYVKLCQDIEVLTHRLESSQRECVELEERLQDVEKELRTTQKRERVTNDAYAKEITSLRSELKAERNRVRRLESEMKVLREVHVVHKKKGDVQENVTKKKQEKQEKKDVQEKIMKKNKQEKEEEKVPTIKIAPEIKPRRNSSTFMSTQVILKKENEDIVLDDRMIEDLQNKIAEKEVELAVASGLRSITKLFW